MLITTKACKTHISFIYANFQTNRIKLIPSSMYLNKTSVVNKCIRGKITDAVIWTIRCINHLTKTIELHISLIVEDTIKVAPFCIYLQVIQ